jgi:hypothetical protein
VKHENPCISATQPSKVLKILQNMWVKLRPVGPGKSNAAPPGLVMRVNMMWFGPAMLHPI